MDERGRPDQADNGVLDAVRRILIEDQTRSSEPPGEAIHRPGKTAEADDDVLELEPSMMIDNQPAGGPRQIDHDRQILGEQTEQTARHSLGSLRSVIREQRAVLTHRGGPSIEDIIREEMRPLLREWLDAHLPKIVEQLVRAEIARIVEREGA